MIGLSQKPIYLEPSMALHHGLILGGAKMGKSTSLKKMAEEFSSLNVPILAIEAKGDFSSLGQEGKSNKALKERLETLGQEKSFTWKSYPLRLWDPLGQVGLSMRTTPTEMGPLLLSHLLNLNTQQSVALQTVFKVADKRGWQLDDLKDLQAMIQYVSSEQSTLKKTETISSEEGTQLLNALKKIAKPDRFFGLPLFQVKDLLATSQRKGMINVLQASELSKNPRQYSSFVLWLLSQINESLPKESGLTKPKLVILLD